MIADARAHYLNSNAYFRSTPLDYPLISLSGYLKFWGVAFIVVTAYLAWFQPEDPVAADDPDMDLRKVYTIMWDICKLKRESRPSAARPSRALLTLGARPPTPTDVQTFVMVHLVTKLGTAANDAATSLKLLEKGLKKEDLALAVLIDFPFQILFGYLAAKWSKGDKPLKPVSFSLTSMRIQEDEADADLFVSQWLIAMWTRLIWAVLAMLLISNFPQAEGKIPTYYFLLVVFCTVGSSFSR